MFRTRHECGEIYSGVKHLALFLILEFLRCLFFPFLSRTHVKLISTVAKFFACVGTVIFMRVNKKNNLWKVTRKRKS